MATITQNQFRSEFNATNSDNIDLIKSTMDTMNTKTGEVQETPTANTILGRLKEIADNTAGATITTNFTTTNSANVDLMKTSNDNILAKATSLDTKTGEVQATPTANTILGRLKDIADNTAGGVTTNFTTTNSANLDLMKVSNDNIETNTNSLDTKVGEVQATPTANTILGRLKDIADNTAGATITTNFTTTNSTNLDLMKVSNDNIKTNTDTISTNTTSLDTKMGEVQATPTANTILGRLKEIADNTAGATITTNFTTTNSTNLDLMKTSTDTLVTNSNSLDTKVGEVQATPTANTILGRLKDIADNTAGATITTNFTTTNSTNVDAMKTTLDTLDTKTGEVQATPTANTILGRLKEIADNTAGATITTNFTTTNSTNVDLMKTTLDTLNTKTGEVQATPTVNTILGRLKDIADNISGATFTTNFTTTNSTNLDLMKTSTDTLVTNSNSLDTKVGEVQATPTANTILGRLKDIADNTSGGVTTNFTTTNSTNLDLMKVSNDNIKTNTDTISTNTTSLDTKTGEVSATPTANTILGRLKDIADNTAGATITTNFTTTNSTNVDSMKATLDTLNTKTGEVQATPTANTILGRLKDISDNISGATFTTNFTTTNSSNLDLIKTSTDTMATNTTSLDTKVGEVQATPTANTILGRLKEIADNTAGATITTNFTTTNSTNLDLMKVSNDNIKTNTDTISTNTTSLDTKAGEVSATPTANTILGRLKDIADNTAGGITTNFTTTNSTNLDLMKVSNDNILIDTTSLDTKMGEVQATPTANTVLARLKDIADNTAGGVTTNFTTTNSTNLDLMKVSNDNIKTNTDTISTNTTSLDTKTGEVSATPTANTILGRLKDIADNTAGGITTNFTTTNSTNVDAMKATIDTLNTKVGEVQATPTVNTILGRLKDIADNTSGGGSSVTVANTSTNQVYTRVLEFEVSTEITRPANTTAYAINQIVNNSGASVLPALDFSGIGSLANRAIQINSATLISSNGSVATKITPIIHLFNSDSITGQTLTDGTTFNPSYAEVVAKRTMTFEGLSLRVNHGSGFYLQTQIEILRNAILDANSKLYVALITNGAYTPASGEKFTIMIKGYLL